MTDEFQQTPRSRVAEAEKQLRIAHECLSDEHPEIRSLLDEATRDLKDIGERLEAAQPRETTEPRDDDGTARQPPETRPVDTDSVPDDGHSGGAPDTDSRSGQSRHGDGRSEGPHAR